MTEAAPQTTRGLPSGARASRWVKRLLLAGTSLVLTLLVLEGGLRFVLFSDFARARKLGWRWRDAGLYTPREAGRENWKLRVELGLEKTGRSPAFDARFGWLSDAIEPTTLAHVDEARIGGRRPVLLFGDSYAECVAEAHPCWQELLEQSALGNELCLLNYGVSGYGLDQVRLLLEPVLERFAARNPLVVVGILVDDDLDRGYLPLRSFPKPYFTAEGSGLVLHPLEQESAAAYLQAHPVRIRSYLWRWFLFGSGLVSRRTAVRWTDEAEHVAQKCAVNRGLLEEIRSLLAARGLESFFVLFHARRALEASGPYAWQEPFLYRTFAELRLPFVSSKRVLRAHLARTGLAPEELYIRSGPGLNHYTGATNAVVFAALQAGIAGDFEPYAYLPAR